MAGIKVIGGKNVVVDGNQIYDCDVGVDISESDSVTLHRNVIVNSPVAFQIDRVDNLIGKGNIHYERAVYLEGYEGIMGSNWAALNLLTVAIKEASYVNVQNR